MLPKQKKVKKFFILRWNSSSNPLPCKQFKAHDRSIDRGVGLQLGLIDRLNVCFYVPLKDIYLVCVWRRYRAPMI